MKSETTIISADEPNSTVRPKIESSIVCRELPPFPAHDLQTIRNAFSHVSSLKFRQWWLPKEESHFAPASVRLGWRSESLLMLVELLDEKVFNRANGHNQQTWLLGDTLEIFLRPLPHDAYFEFHITPNNHRLQMRFDASRTGCSPDSRRGTLIPGRAFHSQTWIEQEEKRWSVYAEITAKSIGEAVDFLGESKWQFSLARYDYQPDRTEPVLSSTSGYTEPDFHRQHEWSLLNFRRAVISSQ